LFLVVISSSGNKEPTYYCLPLDEGTEYCLYSLKPILNYPEVGKFDTQVDARIKCQMSTTKYNADLAFLGTPRINELAADIVSDMSAPHWFGAFNPEGRSIDWHSSDMVDTWENDHPWDEASGNPNDHEGPETCIFVGPMGRWFDFTCEPKSSPGSDPGPVITWLDGSRKMYNVYPLCAILRTEKTEL